MSLDVVSIDEAAKNRRILEIRIEVSKAVECGDIPTAVELANEVRNFTKLPENHHEA